jgi:DNA-binding transcriptional MerR regulator
MNAEPARAYLGIGEVLAVLRTEFPDIKLSVSKIRFLEAEGLIEPPRSPSGYRRFRPADVDRLRFILTAQRDHYLPLRVIKERLEPSDDGQPPGPGQEPRPLTRKELLDASGISAEVLAELESFGLVRLVGRRYGPEAVPIAQLAAALGRYGVGPRHLRAVRAAADREASLIEQVTAPLLQQRQPAARQQAAESARQIAALSLQLHRVLIECALAEAGFGGGRLPDLSQECSG